MALKGMQGSPLQDLLVSRQVKGLPSMKTNGLSLHMPKIGKPEMQPKVKPLATGSHHSFFPGLK